MAGVQLYGGLIKATEQIVAKFGKDILTEERFVNILQDLYPDRDNPAVFRIVKSMINDGIVSDLESTNKVNVSSIVARLGMSLSQKYGYDKNLVEGILYSVAIGYGSITYSDYNALFAPSKQNQPKQKSQQQKASNRKQNKPAPCKQPQNNQQQPTRHGMTVKYFNYLLWGYAVLLFSPALYLLLTNIAGWWPLPTIILFVVLHFFSVFTIGAVMSDDYENRPNPLVGGLYSGLTCCAGLFWIFCPFLGSDLLLFQRSYYGFLHTQESPSVFSYILFFIIGLLCFSFILGVLGFSGFKYPPKSSLLNKFQLTINNSTYVKGFLTTCLFFLVVVAIELIVPFVGETRQNHKIEHYNEKVDSINARSNQIRAERSTSYQALSFGIFKLGSGLDSCISVAESAHDYKVLEKTGIPYSARDCKINIAGIDYSSIIDTTLYVSTIWDNNSTNVKLSFLEKKLVGISFVTHIDGDSLISMYSKKYGKPEYELVKQNKTDYYYDNVDEYLEDQLIPREYYWTFANGIIKIYVSREFKEYGMTIISMDYDGNIVTYFDRRCEKILQELNAKKKREEEVQERRIQDSLKRLEIEKQKQREEERLRQEKNHQESIDKI